MRSRNRNIAARLLLFGLGLALNEASVAQTTKPVDSNLVINLVLVDSTGARIPVNTRVHVEIDSPYDGQVFSQDVLGSEHRFEVRYHGNNAGDVRIRISSPYFEPLEKRLPKQVRDRTQFAELMLKPVRWAASPWAWEGIHHCCAGLAAVLSDDGRQTSHLQYDRLSTEDPRSTAGILLALAFAHSIQVGSQSVLSGIRAVAWEAPIRTGDRKVWEMQVWADPDAVAAWHEKSGSASFEELGIAAGEPWEELGTQYFLHWTADPAIHKHVADNNCIKVKLRFRPFSVASYENLRYVPSQQKSDFNPPFSIYRGRKLTSVEAVFNGTVEEVRAYLDDGMKVDSTDSNHRTLLELAVAAGRSDVVDLLISRGANVNVESGEPLRSAARNGETQIVKSLLAAHAQQIADSDGYTPIMSACQSGQTDVVQLLISAQAKIVDRTSDRGSLLELAVRSGHASLVQLLLGHGFNPNEETTGGDPLLSIAAFNGFTPIVKELIAAGARPDAKGLTLIAAAMKDYLDVASTLIAHGADVDAGAPLVHAAQEGFLDMVTLLLDAGANPNIQADHGITPLMAACHYGYVEIAQELLENRADPNLSPTGLPTPLIAAAIEGSEETVLMLLKSGANPLTRLDGRVAHDFARDNGNLEVVAALEKHQASAGTVPKEFTWEFIGRKPRNLRHELLTSSIFSDLPLLIHKDTPHTSLDLSANETNRLNAEVDFLLTTALKLYRQNRANLTATFGQLPNNPQIRFVLADDGTAGASIDPTVIGKLRLDVKLLRANLRASIDSAFPDLSSQSDAEKIAFVKEMQRRVRKAESVNRLHLTPNGPGGLKGSLEDFGGLEEYTELLDLAKEVMTADVQYFGTLLFVIAHEMGHVVLNHSSQSNGDCEERELQADKFAAALLGRSFLALSAKVVSVQLGGAFVKNSRPGHGYWYFDHEALDRYAGFSVFFDKGYEFANFPKTSGCKYPEPDRRLAATRMVLNDIERSDADKTVKAIQKRKDMEAFVRSNFAQRYSVFGLLH